MLIFPVGIFSPILSMWFYTCCNDYTPRKKFCLSGKDYTETAETNDEPGKKFSAEQVHAELELLKKKNKWLDIYLNDI